MSHQYSIEEYSELISSLSDEDITDDLHQHTLLILYIIVYIGYGSFFEFSLNVTISEEKKDSITELNTILINLEAFSDLSEQAKYEFTGNIDENDCVKCIRNLLCFNSKCQRIACWNAFDEKLSSHDTLSFIWKELHDEMENGFCERPDCDHVTYYDGYSRGNHYHCDTCGSTDDCSC